MDISLLDHALTALAGAIPGGAAGVVAGLHKWKKRLEDVEAAVAELRKAGGEGGLTESTLFEHVRRAVNELATRASRPDVQVTHEAMRSAIAEAMREMRHDVDTLERTLDEVRGLAQRAVASAEFTEHLTHETERWNEVNRALGKIEGMLHGVRDRMGGSRR